MAVQIAKLLGANHVIAAGRDAGGLAALPALGATATVLLDGDADDIADRLGQAAADVDVVIDYLWGEPAAAAMTAVVTNRADRQKPLTWIQIGSVAGPTAPIPSAALRAARLQIVGSGQGSVSDAGVPRRTSRPGRGDRRRHTRRRRPGRAARRRRTGVGRCHQSKPAHRPHSAAVVDPTPMPAGMAVPISDRPSVPMMDNGADRLKLVSARPEWRRRVPVPRSATRNTERILRSLGHRPDPMERVTYFRCPTARRTFETLGKVHIHDH